MIYFNFPIRVLNLLCAYCLFSLPTIAQTQTSENPVVYVESFFGGSKGRAGGFSGGAELNYQAGRSLFSARIIGNFKFGSQAIRLSPFTAIPSINLKSSVEEYAALYGLRFINEGRSLSISAGISHNSFREWYRDDEHKESFDVKSSYIGVPYELNIKWFKPERRRFRIYGLIPVGKETSFGGSLGFKLFGSISKYSYGGLGITYGLGYHKRY